MVAVSTVDEPAWNAAPAPTIFQKAGPEVFGPALDRCIEFLDALRHGSDLDSALPKHNKADADHQDE